MNTAAELTAPSIAVSEIVDLLQEEIALGLLRPRERLVEDELMNRFRVKRHVVRQALVDLEAMGVVVRQPNKGAAVRDFHAGEVENLYEVRELVERRAAELIPLPGAPDLVAALKTIQARHHAAVKTGDLRRVYRENIAFHRVLFGACGNSALAEVIEQFAQRTHAIRSYAIRDSNLLEQLGAEHVQMIEAIESGARERLVTLVTQHIQPAKTTYLRLTRSILGA